MEQHKCKHIVRQRPHFRVCDITDNFTCVSANITLFPGMPPIFSGNHVDTICGFSLWSIHGVMLYEFCSYRPTHKVIYLWVRFLIMILLKNHQWMLPFESNVDSLYESISSFKVIIIGDKDTIWFQGTYSVLVWGLKGLRWNWSVTASPPLTITSNLSTYILNQHIQSDLFRPILFTIHQL